MLDRMFSSLRAFWLAVARASRGGSTLELPGGIGAAILPAMPDRSVMNCVVYDDAEELGRRLEELDAAYDDAGVTAWTVWVHESDERARSLLAGAGHRLDAQPMAQVLELADLGSAPEGPELDLIGDPGPDDFDPIVAGAYGWPGFADAMLDLPFHAYVARHEGRPACCLGIFDHKGDASVEVVATAPEARSRGLASRLLHRALVDGRERGNEIATLQATAMGQPVYTRLGFRDLGRVQMWERRKPA